MAALAGTKPSYTRLSVRNPVAWFKTFFSPLSAAHFALSDPAKLERAVGQIWRRQRWRLLGYPLVFLLARALQVDRLVDALAIRRYTRQRRRRPARVSRPAAKVAMAD